MVSGLAATAVAGFAFGVGYFGLGVNWVYHSLRLFGGATSFFAILYDYYWSIGSKTPDKIN